MPRHDDLRSLTHTCRQPGRIQTCSCSWISLVRNSSAPAALWLPRRPRGCGAGRGRRHWPGRPPGPPPPEPASSPAPPGACAAAAALLDTGSEQMHTDWLQDAADSAGVRRAQVRASPQLACSTAQPAMHQYSVEPRISSQRGGPSNSGWLAQRVMHGRRIICRTDTADQSDACGSALLNFDLCA